MIDDSQDLVVAKLKGYNVLLKFIDGEELLLTIDKKTDEEFREWFQRVENYLNCGGEDYFPLSDIAIARSTVKYAKRI